MPAQVAQLGQKDKLVLGKQIAITGLMAVRDLDELTS